MKEYIVQPVNNIDEGACARIPEGFVIDAKAEDPDAILVRSKNLHDMVFNPGLKFIGRAGSGVNNIPLDRCSENGIVVCNTPGANANGVKELVALSMIMASRNIVEALRWTQKLPVNETISKQVESGKKDFVGPELYGKKVGVIGLGEIGALVANMCVDFGMEVYGYDPFLTVKHAWALSSRITRANDLSSLFETCDFVTLHVPYNEDTKHTVNRDLLAKAKPGLCLINLARGGLVDHDALKAAIDDGIVSHYVVDFPDEKTMHLPRTINIPHLGASTPESEANAAAMVIDEMIDYLKNGNIHNSVNFPNVDFGVCSSLQRITVLHRNIPNMIGQIANRLAEQHINIARMSNKHKENWAYTVIDIDSDANVQVLEMIQDIDGVVRVRKLEGSGSDGDNPTV